MTEAAASVYGFIRARIHHRQEMPEFRTDTVPHTHFVDSVMTPFVDSVTHFVDSVTHFVDSATHLLIL